MGSKHSSWHMYVVECSDGSYYCGITTDIKRRISEHNTSKKGAKYTRSRRPVFLISSRKCLNKTEACLNERHFKKLSRKEKIAFLKNLNMQ